MQSQPPDTTEWILLMMVGALAGTVNTLRRYSQKGTRQSLLVGATEGITALFVTIIAFLMLDSLLPVVFGWEVSRWGIIGLSGAIAHMGLRQTIRFVLRYAEEKAPD